MLFIYKESNLQSKLRSQGFLMRLLLVLPENQEKDPLHSAIAASRVRQRNPYTSLGFLRRVKVFLKLHLSFLKRH